MELKVRKLRDDDLPFIASTWIDHVAAIKYFRKCPRRIIKENLFEKVKAIAKSRSVLVSCSSEDDNQIFGYIIYNGESLHFLYTKLLYRGMGIASALLSQCGQEFKQVTTQSDDRWFRKYMQKHNMIFNPWGQS